MKDRTSHNLCNLESVLWYHIECPEYLKKWDDPKHYKHLKRQMFNLLTLPYMKYRMDEHQLSKEKKKISDIEKASQFIEYPEEIEDIPLKKHILENKNMKEKFIEGVTFDADEPEAEE